MKYSAKRLAIRGFWILFLFLSSIIQPVIEKTNSSLTSNPQLSSDKGNQVGTQGWKEFALKRPLQFEDCQNQSQGRAEYLARGQGYNVFLTQAAVTLTLTPDLTETIEKQSFSHSAGHASSSRAAAVSLKLMGANANSEFEGVDLLPGKTNYFLGNNSAQWHSGVLNYSRVRNRNVYPGIDVVYYGNQQQLEYDFLVAAGADPEAIQFQFEGVGKLGLDGNGDLLLQTAAGELRQHKPQIYQQMNGNKREIAGGYRLHDDGHISFRLGPYDKSLPLVIDPVLSYSALIGDANGLGMAVDQQGNAYVIGVTQSLSFPITPGAYRPAHGRSGSNIAFITKINPTGTAVLYSTFFGGFSNVDLPNNLTIDSSGNAYIVGATTATDFPVTAGAYQTQLSAGSSNVAGDAFITKLNADGSGLLYSTYLGGSGGHDIAQSIEVDAAGNAYIGGSAASGFPITPGAAQSTLMNEIGSGFVAKLSPNGDRLFYSTYRTANTRTGVSDIALDSAGNVYLTGERFPRPYVAKLNATGTQYLFVRELDAGNNYNEGKGIALDSAGNVYITGIAGPGLATTANAFQRTFGGNPTDAFVAKVSSAGTVLYTSYLGGNSEDTGSAIAVDSTGNAFVTGKTGSSNFPVTPNAIQSALTAFPGSSSGDRYDAFVTKVNTAGSSLAFSSYLGGYDADEGRAISIVQNQIYVGGWTTGTASFFGLSYPTTAGALQTRSGRVAAFVTKIDESINGTADLAASLATSGPVPVGGRGAYIIKATNVGNVISVGAVRAEISLSQSVTVISAGGAGWSCPANFFGTQITCGYFGQILPGESTSDLYIEFRLGSISVGDLMATATVTNFGDVSASNNVASDQSTPITTGCFGTFGGVVGASNTVPASGGIFDHPVNAPATCTWKAVSNVSWIKINSGQITGNGAVNYTVEPNTSNQQRVGTFTFEGLSKEVRQAGVSVVSSVSAASFGALADFGPRDVLAPESIAAAFGSNLATGTAAANALPLPTSLLGTSVRIKDFTGAEHLAPLFFVSPQQINYLIPKEVASGPITVTVTNANGESTTGTGQIALTAPGIFTANSDGTGAIAGVILRYKADGSQTYEPVADFENPPGRYVPREIDLGPETDQVFLILFCTGIRNHALPPTLDFNVTHDSAIVYAGPQGGFEGLDQVNVKLSRQLIGTGERILDLKVDGVRSNLVRVKFK